VKFSFLIFWVFGATRLMLGNDVYQVIRLGDNEEDVGRVLRVGFPVDSRDSTGWTALHHAAHMGRLSCLSTLLEHQADANARTREGHTPLFLAARNGHLGCLEMLHSYHHWLLSNRNGDLLFLPTFFFSNFPFSLVGR